MNNADDRPTVGRDWIAFVVAWIPYSLLTYRFWHNVARSSASAGPSRPATR